MLARLLALLVLLSPLPALADPLEGSWALKAGGAAIFRFDIAKRADGKWQGTWIKPSSFASDGNHFTRLKGPPKKVTSMTALDTPNGVELSFNDPRPGAVPDIFDFKTVDEDAVEMTYVGTDLKPYTLERVEPDAEIGPWDADTTYAREDAPPPPDAAPAKQGPPAALEGFKLKPGAMAGR